MTADGGEQPTAQSEHRSGQRRGAGIRKPGLAPEGRGTWLAPTAIVLSGTGAMRDGGGFGDRRTTHCRLAEAYGW